MPGGATAVTAQAGMRGGLSDNGTPRTCAGSRPSPPENLVPKFVLRRVGAGNRTWDNTIVMCQGSDSATHRSSRVSLRRPGRVVCSRGWAVPLTNLFTFRSLSLVVQQCTRSITGVPNICEQSPVTKLEMSGSGSKMIQPSLTASTRLFGVRIHACAHCDPITGRGSDWFRRLLQGFTGDDSVNICKNIRIISPRGGLVKRTGQDGLECGFNIRSIQGRRFDERKVVLGCGG